VRLTVLRCKGPHKLEFLENFSEYTPPGSPRHTVWMNLVSSIPPIFLHVAPWRVCPSSITCHHVRGATCFGDKVGFLSRARHLRFVAVLDRGLCVKGAQLTPPKAVLHFSVLTAEMAGIVQYMKGWMECPLHYNIPTADIESDQALTRPRVWAMIRSLLSDHRPSRPSESRVFFGDSSSICSP